VRRFVVPLHDPEQVGEPGPIYAYASPVSAQAATALGSRATMTFPGLSPRVVARQDRSPHTLSERQRLLRAIAALRAFQHMPYRTDQALINWTGVNPQGRVEVTVSTTLPVSDAEAVWQAFLRRFDDRGQAYTVTFQTPPGPPLDTAVPTISGTPSQGQTLTESPGIWSNNPTAYTYQWEDCDPSGQSCSPIGGATGPTYTLTAEDVGDTVRVQEVASNTAGAGQPAQSAPTAVVAASPLGPG
jgi:hypothetical protein